MRPYLTISLMVGCIAVAQPPARLKIEAAYAGLPLSFAPNQGQADPAARFLARFEAGSLILTANETLLRLPGGTVRMKLQGGALSPDVAGEDELPGRVNYFLGKDPAQWRTNIPTYATVRYRDVYPGVDLVFHGHGKRLEYDFVVAPGADAGAIQVAFEGADSLRVDAAGDLRLGVRNAEIRWRKPVVYQETARGRRILAARYELARSREVAFRVDAYDHSRALVIDPVLDAASYLGGNASEGATGIAVDAAGNAYVTGYATSPTGFPIFNPLADSAGWSGSFVSKLNSAGTSFVYSTYLGGRGAGTRATGIAVDAGGNAYITGTTSEADFPLKNPLHKDFRGRSDAFLTKLNASGSALIYSTYLGGAGGDQGTAIAVDATGSAYVAGTTDPYPQATPLFADHANAFVVRINPAGSAVVYSTPLGGSLSDQATGIAVDRLGSAYVTGLTSSPDFPTRNAVQPHAGGAVLYKSSDGGKSFAPADSGLAAGAGIVLVDPQTPSTLYMAGENGIFKSVDEGGSWKPVNGGISNKRIVAFAIDPSRPATLYATAGGGGLIDPPSALYKTTSGGASWSEISLEPYCFRCAPIVAVDPSDSATLYAGIDRGVLKSTDGGTTWHVSYVSGYAQQVVIDSRRPATIYALDYSPDFGLPRLSKTTDGGDTWQRLDNTLDGLAGIRLDPADSSIVFAGTRQGIARSTDGGLTWKIVFQSGTTLLNVINSGGASTVYASGADGLASSSDKGETWLAAGLAIPSDVSVLAADPSQPGTIYAGRRAWNNAFLAKLDSGGRVVYATYLGGSRNEEGRAVAVDAQGNAYITGVTSSRDFAGYPPGRALDPYSSRAFAAKLSADGATLLYATAIGGSGTDIGLGIAVDSGGNAYIAGSTDSPDFPTRGAVQPSLGGSPFAKATDSGITSLGEGLAGSDFRVLASDPNSTTVFAGGANGVFVSRDGGAHWTATGLTSTPISVLAIDPQTPSTIYAAAGDGASLRYRSFAGAGVFQSTDGGRTWHSANNGLTSLNVTALLIDPMTPAALYAGTSAGIHKSTDSGQNWTLVSHGLTGVLAMALDPERPYIVYVIAAGGGATNLFRSDDSGATFTTILEDSDYWNAFNGWSGLVLDPATPSTVYALVWGALYKSGDSGSSWQPLDAGYERCGYFTLAIDPSRPSNLYAAGSYEGHSCVSRSTDAAAPGRRMTSRPASASRRSPGAGHSLGRCTRRSIRGATRS